MHIFFIGFLAKVGDAQYTRKQEILCFPHTLYHCVLHFRSCIMAISKFSEILKSLRNAWLCGSILLYPKYTNVLTWFKITSVCLPNARKLSKLKKSVSEIWGAQYTRKYRNFLKMKYKVRGAQYTRVRNIHGKLRYSNLK